MNILTLLEGAHNICFLSFIIPFITNNKTILWWQLYFLITVYLGWIIFNNKCWVSILEQKLNNETITDSSGNTLQYRIKKYSGIELSPKIINTIFWLISYTTLLVLTYKLNIFWVGIIWIIVWDLFFRYRNLNQK